MVKKLSNVSLPAISISAAQWGIVREILCTCVPEYEVWAFGSRVTGKVKKFSDLDLAIITENPLSLDASADLRDNFAESDLPWKVDIVDWSTTSEVFRSIIQSQKVVLQSAKKTKEG